MPFISVTRLRLRGIRFLPGFALDAFRTRGQAARAPGFRNGAILADRDRTFWTMTAWDDAEAMRRYMTDGAHRTAMPRLLHWCDEASIVHWMQDEAALPSWPEADRRMRAEGRASKVGNPSPQHASLSYRPPRVTASAPIGPAQR